MMLGFKPTKKVLANLCLFIVIAGFVYHGKKYSNYNLTSNGNPEEQIEESNAIINETLELNTPVRNLPESLNKGLFTQKYKKTLCKLDKPNIDKLLQYNASVNELFNSRKVKDYVNNFFHEFIQNPHRSFCNEMKRFGGNYYSFCKFTDGSKFVCMDEVLKDIEKEECLIYSFGIADDWTFEDIMDDLGCKIYAFDGSVDFPKRRGKNIHFEKSFIGPKDKESENKKTFQSALAQNGHLQTKISYLKMDIEGNELKRLPQWLREGTLNNVQQIGMEFHLTSQDMVKTHKFIRVLRYLYFKSNYRLISYEANGCAQNANKDQFGKYYDLAEIVLKKVNDNDKCH